jgi:hypothetical protein
MIINKTIQLEKDARRPSEAITRARNIFMREIKNLEDVDFGKHFVLLKGIIQDDLIIIERYIDKNFKLKTEVRHCTNEEHTEYLKKKWENEPTKHPTRRSWGGNFYR